MCVRVFACAICETKRCLVPLGHLHEAQEGWEVNAARTAGPGSGRAGDHHAHLLERQEQLRGCVRRGQKQASVCFGCRVWVSQGEVTFFRV